MPTLPLGANAPEVGKEREHIIATSVPSQRGEARGVRASCHWPHGGEWPFTDFERNCSLERGPPAVEGIRAQRYPPLRGRGRVSGHPRWLLSVFAMNLSTGGYKFF